MEEYLKSHVNKNLPALIRNTECSTLLIADLISSQVIGADDEDKLRTPGLTDYEKARELYNILLRKKNAFEILLQALNNCNQSGAASIIQEGIDGWESVILHESECEFNYDNDQEQRDIQLLLHEQSETSQLEASTRPFSNKLCKTWTLMIVFILIILVALAITLYALNTTPNALPTSTPFPSTIPATITNFTTESTSQATSTTQPSPTTSSSSKTSSSTTSSTPIPKPLKFTFATILLVGPLGNEETSELISNLIGFSPDCTTKQQLETINLESGIWRYDITGCQTTPCDFDYRLVILNVPVLVQQGSDDDMTTYMKAYVAHCTAESYCGRFFFAFPVTFMWNLFQAGKYNDGKVQGYFNAMKSILESLSISISNTVFIFEEKGLTYSAKVFERDDLLPFLQSVPNSYVPQVVYLSLVNNFWDFLSKNLPDVSREDIRMEKLYFSQMRKGKNGDMSHVHCNKK